MVVYADDESFTFMTPEGHTLSAWITFSAYRDGEATVAQAQALERTSDPFDELAYMLGGNRMNDRFWRETLANVATTMGVADPTRRCPGRVHRSQAAVAARRQHPQLRDAAHGTPHAHGPGPLADPTLSGGGAGASAARAARPVPARGVVPRARYRHHRYLRGAAATTGPNRRLDRVAAPDPCVVHARIGA